MEIYVARQPIFDKRMKVYGYELLYRKSMNNYYEGTDDDVASAELIENSFFSMHFSELVEGKKAFINFSEGLLKREIPLLLPKDDIVIELLERVEVTDEIIELCRSYKEKGYTIALDDFVFSEKYLPLIEIADIIKIEFPMIKIETQRQLIKMFGESVRFLAERIETREEYELAKSMGYSFFQGYFFSKPIIVKGKEIQKMNTAVFQVVSELNLETPDMIRIIGIIERDVGLSYKILRLVNSVAFGSLRKIESIHDAVVRMGITELRKWIYVIQMKELQNPESHEIIKVTLLRSKIMEEVARRLENGKQSEFFLVGILSTLDVLLNRDMKEVLAELPISDEVKEAILYKENLIGKVLERVIMCENAEWYKEEFQIPIEGLDSRTYLLLYITAIKWLSELDL